MVICASRDNKARWCVWQWGGVTEGAEHSILYQERCCWAEWWGGISHEKVAFRQKEQWFAKREPSVFEDKIRPSRLKHSQREEIGRRGRRGSILWPCRPCKKFGLLGWDAGKQIYSWDIYLWKLSSVLWSLTRIKWIYFLQIRHCRVGTISWSSDKSLSKWFNWNFLCTSQ